MPRPRQYADRVNVVKQIKVNSIWRFAPVVEKQGKIVRDQVMINGKVEAHPEGKYFIEWYEDGKRRRKSVGSNPVLPSTFAVGTAAQVTIAASALAAAEMDPGWSRLRSLASRIDLAVAMRIGIPSRVLAAVRAPSTAG